MSEPPPVFSMESIRTSLAGFAAMCGTITVSVGFVGSIVWWAASPHLSPYLDAINKIPEIASRVSTLETRVPVPRVIVYRDRPFVPRPNVAPGGSIRIQYFMQRTDDCNTTITPRFYSYDFEGYDPRFVGETRPDIRAPVTTDVRPFSIVLTVPETMPPGAWAYAPEITPGDDCLNRELIYPPLADFVVTGTGEEGSNVR